MGPEPLPDLRPQESIFSFGVFELDLRAGELRKYGLKIKLQDQPLQILTLLLEQAGKAVTREEIQARLWAAGTHVDYENAINSAVRKLREALSDNAENPRFIETLPRRGYRFVAPVSQRISGPTLVRPSVSRHADETTPTAHRRNRWVYIGAAVVIISGLAGAGWFLWRQRQAVNTQLTPAVPLTGSPGVECCPSFSPDGSRVAFSRISPGEYKSDLFVKLIGPGEPLRLTQNPALGTFPAWSPDGRWIAFLRILDDRSAAVLLMPSLGGPERELTTVTLDFRKHHFGPATAWSADGKFLFTPDDGRRGLGYGIVRIAVDTGEKRQVTTPPAGTVGDGAPSVSPDGRTLAFIRTVTVHVQGDIYVLPLSADLATPAGEAARVTSDSKLITSHAWMPNGRDIVFSSDRGGRFELWLVAPYGSRKPVRFTGAGESSADIAISREGHRLVYTQQGVDGPLLSRMEIAGNKAGKPERIPWSTLGDCAPQYSPDGEKIAFQSNRLGRWEIWTANEDGSGAIQLSFSDAGFSGTPRWSPDGRSIAFDSSRDGAWRIYVVNSQGGKPMALTTGSANGMVPSWSRDGKFVYFASTRSGAYEVWKSPAQGGPAMQVTKKGGLTAFESADGKDLYYTKSESNGQLWRMPVEGGEETQVLPNVGGRNFAVASSRIYFFEQADDAISLKALKPGTGEIATLTVLRHSYYRYYPVLTVSPDERTVVYPQMWDDQSRYGSRLMLVENFR